METPMGVRCMIMPLPSTAGEAQHKVRRKKTTETEAQVRYDTVKGVDCAFGLMDTVGQKPRKQVAGAHGRRSTLSLALRLY